MEYKFITIISGILIILAFSELVYGVHITKNTEHLTFKWIFLTMLAQTLLVFYGIMNKIYGIYLPAIIVIMGLIYILYIKLIFTYNSGIEKELKDKNILK